MVAPPRRMASTSLSNSLFLRCIILSFCSLILLGPGDVSAREHVRVLLGHARSTTVVSGHGLTVIDRAGRTYSPGNRAVIRVAGGNLFTVNRSRMNLAGPLRLTARRGALRWRGNPFPGSFELWSQGPGGIDVINVLEMDSYLCGLLSAEIPLDWPSEALKAQAVAARTYAIWKKINSQNPYDLVASTLDQVYKGMGVPDPRALQAVKETEGWVIVYRGEPILAYYHSCCGGHTDTAWDIKNRDLPYVRGIPCPFCANSPKYRWQLSIPAKRLARLLTRAGFVIGSVDEILPIKQTPFGRIVDLEITSPRRTYFLTGEDLRKVVGYRDLKSARFRVEKRNQTFVLTGSGYGHGLGACQWGMKGMAQRGHSWHQILRYYYQGIEFRRLR